MTSLSQRSRDHSPKACFFDFDGLLAETRALWHAAFRQACEGMGGQISSGDLEMLNGASIQAASLLLSKRLQIDIPPRAILRALTELFRRHPPTLKPGVADLLPALQGSTILMVVTNGPEWLVAESLTTLGIHTFFDGVLGCDRVKAPKPAPDIYLAACREANVSGLSSVAFEDSQVGIRAARDAGLETIGIPSDMEHLDADLVLESLDDPSLLEILGFGA